MNMKTSFEEMAYEAPAIEVIYMCVEKGFEESNMETPKEDDPTDW